MSDDSLRIDIVTVFDRIAELRAAASALQTPQAIATPDVFEASATESLRVVAELIGSLPSFAGWELTMLANTESMGAMDAYRADNSCINWYEDPGE